MLDLALYCLGHVPAESSRARSRADRLGQLFGHGHAHLPWFALMQGGAGVEEDLDRKRGHDGLHYLVARHRGEGPPEGLFERAQPAAGVLSLPGIIWLILILVGRAHPIMLPLVARCATDLLIGRPGRSSDDPERPC